MMAVESSPEGFGYSVHEVLSGLAYIKLLGYSQDQLKAGYDGSYAR